MAQTLTMTSRTGERIEVPLQRIEALSRTLAGTVLTPWHDRYPEARRIWNGLIDRRPALVARCASTDDVVACVRFARSLDLLVAVRAGGHNVAGHALNDGGLVIDLSLMRGVRVDPARRVARVQGGATLGEVDAATAPLGLAVPLGLVSATGVAGLVLHGGYGWLSRRAGLSADNLLGAEVVLADGTRAHASADENPDLLWALRGGGGNFGVVTELELQAWPAGPQVFFSAVFYPLDRAAELLAAFRDIVRGSPRELGALATLWTTRDVPALPERARSQPVAVLGGCWTGDPSEGERVTRPLRELGAPLADLSGPMPWVEVQRFFDEDYPDGRLYYWKSLYLERLDDAALAALARLGRERPSPLSSVDLWVLDGAVGAPAPDATAFARRRSPYLVAFESSWDDPRETATNVAWTRAAWQELDLFSGGETYLNFPGFAEEGERLVRGAYGANWDRLRALKARYDPDNVLHGNFNIPPRE